MKLRVKKRKHNKTYFENNCIYSMPLEGKEVCPLCRIEPHEILECSTDNGKIIFFKKCISCNGIVRIERKSQEL